MKTRCLNANVSCHPDYGGRGITICPEWGNSFEEFSDWALANGYATNLTIDRINNNGNYEPTNCKFSTYQEQENNRRDNYIVTVTGITDTLANMCRLFSVNYHTACTRIFRDKRTAEEALICMERR
jgi:hypothetical protein